MIKIVDLCRSFIQFSFIKIFDKKQKFENQNSEFRILGQSVN